MVYVCGVQHFVKAVSNGFCGCLWSEGTSPPPLSKKKKPDWQDEGWLLLSRAVRKGCRNTAACTLLNRNGFFMHRSRFLKRVVPFMVVPIIVTTNKKWAPKGKVKVLRTDFRGSFYKAAWSCVPWSCVYVAWAKPPYLISSYWDFYTAGEIFSVAESRMKPKPKARAVIMKARSEKWRNGEKNLHSPAQSPPPPWFLNRHGSFKNVFKCKATYFFLKCALPMMLHAMPLCAVWKVTIQLKPDVFFNWP